MTEKRKLRYIVAIDPDLHKSGYAVYGVDDKKLTECTSLFLWEVFENLTEFLMHIDPNDYVVRLEYPKNTNTYHGGGKGAALNVGKNQAIAIVIREFMECNLIPHELVYPAGYSTLFENDEFFKRQTGWIGRTNKDARTAAAICWNYR